MKLYPNERTALFIDGSNLHATAKSLGFDIDFRRLLLLFESKTRLVRALYYTAVPREPEYAAVRPLLDWLNYNGFSVVTKSAREFTDSAGRTRFRGTMHVELSVDAMRLASALDHVVIFSGDGDLVSLVAALQELGKRVSVISTLQTEPHMVADDLRRRADHFIDLADLEKEIDRRYPDIPDQRNGNKKTMAVRARDHAEADDDDG